MRSSPHFPFSPRRFPFYYGWVILFACTVGVVMSIPGQTMGVSVFTDYLIDALGVSRVQLSAAYMAGTIASSLMLPWSGDWFDRWGARMMVVFSASMLGVTLLVLCQCDRIAHGVAWLTGPGPWAALAVMAIGFTLLRFSGQGLLSMTSRAMLGKWFNRYRGFASGLNGVIVTFLFSFAPLGLNGLVNSFGWRGAWVWMALASFAMAALGWLLYRDNPEECGLTMDGLIEEDEAEHTGVRAHHIYKEYTRGEAIRTFSFWVFNAGLGAYALIVTELTFHIVSIGEDFGLDRDHALAIFLPMAVVSIACNFIFGWVCDKVKLKYTLVVMMVTMLVGVGATPYLQTPAGWWIMVFGLGATGGIFSPLLTVVWPAFFGRRHLGAISGISMSVIVFSSAIGPYLFGLSKVWFGDYQAGVWASMAIPAVTLLLAFTAENPQDRWRAFESR
ncbi:MAG: MFS transporter [bacterium]|nr:MFS transporter [bacterium]